MNYIHDPEGLEFSRWNHNTSKIPKTSFCFNIPKNTWKINHIYHLKSNFKIWRGFWKPLDDWLGLGRTNHIDPTWKRSTVWLVPPFSLLLRRGFQKPLDNLILVFPSEMWLVFQGFWVIGSSQVWSSKYRGVFENPMIFQELHLAPANPWPKAPFQEKVITWPGNSAASFGRNQVHKQTASCKVMWEASSSWAVFCQGATASHIGNKIWQNSETVSVGPLNPI